VRRIVIKMRRQSPPPPFLSLRHPDDDGEGDRNDEVKASRTASTIADKSAKAPSPSSPHASLLVWGGTIRTNCCDDDEEEANPCTVDSCCCVNGCSHMAVFIAGASTTGLPVVTAVLLLALSLSLLSLPLYCPKSHARSTHDSVSSHRPVAILASVCAESGAIASTSAQFRSSTCNTESPNLFQSRHSSSGSL